MTHLYTYIEFDFVEVWLLGRENETDENGTAVCYRQRIFDDLGRSGSAPKRKSKDVVVEPTFWNVVLRDAQQRRSMALLNASHFVLGSEQKNRMGLDSELSSAKKKKKKMRETISYHFPVLKATMRFS